MPLYEYRCQACGHETEVLQKVSDRPLRRCPKCSGKFEKLISRTSFQLKGGGWYAHGYHKDSKRSGGDGKSKGTGGSKKDGSSKKSSRGGSAASA